MKKYLILTSEDGLLGPYTYTKKHMFSTFEEAVEFANTLNFSVIIYESIAETEINHTVTRLKNAPK